MDSKISENIIDGVIYTVKDYEDIEFEKVSTTYTLKWPSDNTVCEIDLSKVVSVRFVAVHAYFVFMMKNGNIKFLVQNYLTHRADFFKTFMFIFELCAKNGIAFSTDSFSVPF